MRIDTGAVLRAHEYLRIERPPRLWDLSVDDAESFFRLLGEMIAHGLSRGNELAQLTLNANNVIIDHDDGPTARGNYVTLTVRGGGDWSPEQTWPTENAPFVNADLHGAAAEAAVPYAYTRVLAEGGSITAYLPAASAEPSTR